MTTSSVPAPPATPYRLSMIERWRAFGRPPRLLGIDVARSLAVFGMIGAHAGIAGAVLSPGGPDLAELVQGRSLILFAVVAGVSVALASGGGDRPRGEELRSARLRMAGRALAVLTIGVALELLGSPIAVILPVYGILFLVLLPFLGLRRRTLAVTAAILALAGPSAIALVQGLTLTATGGTGIGNGFGSGAAVQFLLTGSYPLTVWLPLMLLGLAVGRLPLDRTQVAAALLGAGAAAAALGYGLGDAFNGSVRGWLSDWDLSASASTVASGSAALSGSMPDGGDARPYAQLLSELDLGRIVGAAWGVSPHSGGTWEIIGSGGVALAVIGACLLAARPLRAVLVPFAAVGSMPLTAYAAHVVSFALLFSPFALVPGIAGDPEGSGGVVLWASSVVVLLGACTLWALRRGRGPLETVTAWAARRIDSR
ncbi:MAG: heparan-alpha-glucosaminide N-acetyltransferase domain-containing protein [Microbacterium arborescens]